MSQPITKAKETPTPSTTQPPPANATTTTSGPNTLRRGEPKYVSSLQHEERALAQDQRGEDARPAEVQTHDYVQAALEAQRGSEAVRDDRAPSSLREAPAGGLDQEEAGRGPVSSQRDEPSPLASTQAQRQSHPQPPTRTQQQQQQSSSNPQQRLPARPAASSAPSSQTE